MLYVAHTVLLHLSPTKRGNRVKNEERKPYMDQRSAQLRASQPGCGEASISCIDIPCLSLLEPRKNDGHTVQYYALQLN